MVVRWRFYEKANMANTYTWEVNPNAGGSPGTEKAMTQNVTTGPRRTGILQEGQYSPPSISFSGVILTQAHYEAMEDWFTRRVLLEMRDDLGRRFVGVFSSWQPERVYKASNAWYHTYQATFLAAAYRNASGVSRYGKYF